MIILILACACFCSSAQVNIITTIAGKDSAGYSGDGGPAINAKLYSPDGICIDKGGNLYIADAGNSKIRKIDHATGIITTIAGSGGHGYFGDGGAASNAKLWVPTDVFLDTTGNIYIADANNYRIRKITASTGIITTIAGIGISGDSGEGGPATGATISQPCGLYVDKSGNVYFTDIDNHKVKKINALTGIITTIAGTGVAGYFGDGGAATDAQLFSPAQVYNDSTGNVFFTDADNNTVRMINVSSGIISTYAGCGTSGYSGNGGPATDALLSVPYGIFIDKLNNVYVTEYGNGTIRKIDGAMGTITAIAGNGTPGFAGDGGPALGACLIPEDICFDSNGTMYIADYENNRIRKVYNAVGINKVGKDNKISVYPNPASNEVTIQIENNATRMYEVSITDFLGRFIYRSNFIGKDIVSVSSWPKGVYCVMLTGENGYRYMERVVVE